MEILLDFPEYYPLCCAKELRGDYVTFCQRLAGTSGLCEDHDRIRCNLPDVFRWNEKMEVRIM